MSRITWWYLHNAGSGRELIVCFKDRHDLPLENNNFSTISHVSTKIFFSLKQTKFYIVIMHYMTIHVHVYLLAFFTVVHFGGILQI
jgi:hypothetical protein